MLAAMIGVALPASHAQPDPHVSIGDLDLAYDAAKRGFLLTHGVELTFVDQTGAELPVIRRSQGRSPQGKLIEVAPNLSILAVDPIGARIGTIMPGLLPLVKVGSESELGMTVSQLTGLSALADLAEHVRRAKAKVAKECVAAKTEILERADQNYSTARKDIEDLLFAHSALTPAQPIPCSSDGEGIEDILDEITNHFEDKKSAAFQSARDILGERFDPANLTLLSDLEKNTGRALERVSRPQELSSAGRLAALRKLMPEQLDAAEARIREIVSEAQVLEALARNPSTAARARLYARVATWISDHPDVPHNDDTCVICGGNLQDAVDPITGQSVRKHLHEATSDAALLSQTLSRWGENAQGGLMRELPETLRAETAGALPEHPCKLLRTAVIDELFGFEPFQGVLGNLRAQTASAFAETVANRAALAMPLDIALPRECRALGETLKRLDRPIRFARWRHGNDVLARGVVRRVLGSASGNGKASEGGSLTGKLLLLEDMVKRAKPISDAIVQCGRLARHLKARRVAERRLEEYAIASKALENLACLGQLADEQVDLLRRTLRDGATKWRSQIYLGAFPDTAHKLTDAGLGRKGELDLVVQTGGISAPAQHVTNASALRASLVAFFLAFWEHVLKERGGIASLILDDPQELLDDENRERLAAAFVPLVDAGAQLRDFARAS